MLTIAAERLSLEAELNRSRATLIANAVGKMLGGK